MAEKIQLTLNQDEALILFEWLASEIAVEKNAIIPDTAEELVFSRLSGQLESVLVAPFDSRYDELLDEARKRVLADTAPRY